MRKVRGFHGTTREAANSILNSGNDFKKSTNRGAWLGAGVYFFEENAGKAREWAKGCVVQQGNGKKPAIIEAELDISNCIDLCNSTWIETLQAASNLAQQNPSAIQQHAPILTTAKEQEYIIQDYDMPKSTWCNNHSDHDIINTLVFTIVSHPTTPDCTSVRGAFNDGRQTHSNSYFFNETHTQIAVFDLSIITVVNRYDV